MADPSTSAPLTRQSVIEAHDLIRPFIHHTPVLTNATLTRLASTPRTAEELRGLGSTQWEWEQQDKSGSSDGDGDNNSTSTSTSSGGASRSSTSNPKIRLWFKCENLQRIGAFKIRGAFHAVERLKREPGWEEGGGKERGVVTHSSGNHAQALSLAARENGMPAHVVMPSIAPPNKIAATRAYGARIVFSGSTGAEREAVCARVVAETGARLVPPYDHPDIVLGQGTLGLELQDDVEAMMTRMDMDEEAAAKAKGDAGQQPKCSFAVVPGTEESRTGGDDDDDDNAGGKDQEKGEQGEKKKKNRKKRGLDAILAPCGGGGMLSGVALSCEGTGIRVFGCEPTHQGADDAKRGFESGQRVETVSTLTIADGLRTPLGRVPWSVIYERRLVSGFYGASEDEIRRALRLVYERMKMVVEPSAVVPLAVALYNEDFRAMVQRECEKGGEKEKKDGWDVGIVFSGGNVSLDALGDLFKVEG
ncbi:pyridoxal-phosphate dependent enzyme-domain-containing protein [Xylariomycetidae sp. FL2044]|nr:pyridoxal-phosphate dependent enzyme-domain-containing protein [Xylariomycetidae sp. FL2044]